MAVVLAAVMAAPLLSTSPAVAAGDPIKPIVYPVKGGGAFTDTWGACRGSNCERRHAGQDLFAPKMTHLLATVDGTVDQMAFGLQLSGNYVSIRGADGWRYLYMHLNNDRLGTDDGRGTPLLATPPGIHVGAKVKAGQVIGYVGDSGNAEPTPPHVHFEIRTPDNVPINPTDSLRAARKTSLDEAAWRSANGSFGAFVLVQPRPGGLRLAGWAIDRSTDAPVPVEVRYAERFASVVEARKPRADLEKYGQGRNHAFDQTVALPGGTYPICLYAGDPDGGPATPIGCRTFTVPGGSPVGALEEVTLSGPNRVDVRGWALDPDVVDATTVHVYSWDAAGTKQGAMSLGPTDLERADIAEAYPGWGSVPRGYDGSVRAVGRARVCAFGINQGPGATSQLGCRDIALPSGNPRGIADPIQALGGGVYALGGESVDPDVADPITVHVHVIPADGTPRRIISAGVADLPRDGIESRWPGWGTAHGFSTVITLDRDATVCTFGLNAPGTLGVNAPFSCQRVDVAEV
ncbi:MAG: M23 family metallopeptidase [Microthrixaceae bacterium]